MQPPNSSVALAGACVEPPNDHKTSQLGLINLYSQCSMEKSIGLESVCLGHDPCDTIRKNHEEEIHSSRAILCVDSTSLRTGGNAATTGSTPTQHRLRYWNDWWRIDRRCDWQPIRGWQRKRYLDSRWCRCRCSRWPSVCVLEGRLL